MMFFSSLKLAIRATLSNKMRSFLTMLGIIIGVMSVVMLISITKSSTSTITDAINSMGTELLSVTVTDTDASLKESDFMVLEEYSDYISDVSPYITVSGAAKSGSEYTMASVKGVTEKYMDINDMELQAGRKIVASDLEWRTRVAVIGTDIAEDLWESYDVLGKKFTFNGQSFMVVGLLEESGTTLSGSIDSSIMIPLTTAKRISDTTSITTASIRAKSSDTVETAQKIVEAHLYDLLEDEDSYSVLNISTLLDALDTVMDTMSLMLGGIAGISLLVGGIGIMNIMLVSVAERTREIGIRKAIGARRLHIMLQFLIEACVLSILGGVIGLLISALGLRIISYIADFEFAVNPSAASIALIFCVLIGIIFGSYPAAKASKLTPIEALQRK